MSSDMAAFNEEANPWRGAPPEKMPDLAEDFFARWRDPDAVLAAFPQAAETFLPFRQPGRLDDFPPAERARILAKAVLQLHSGLPRHLVLEASCRCQLNCAFCSARGIAGLRRQTVMELDDFRKMWRHAEFFTHSLDLTGGEPLLNPDLAWIVRLARKTGVHVTVSTNGMVLDRRRAEELLDADPSAVIVSCDATEKPGYEAARTGGDFPLLCENIRAFAALAKKRPRPRTRLALRFLATDGNFAEREGFWRLAREFGADFALLRHFRIPPDASRSMRRRLYRDSALKNAPESCYHAAPDGDLAPVKTAPGCTRSRHPAYIGSGGEIIDCLYFPRNNPSGNAVDQPFAATWFADATIRRRLERIRHGLHHGCRWCPGEWREDWYEERIFTP